MSVMPGNSSPTDDAVWASRAELLYTIDRIREAITALPNNPNELTLHWWNYCIS